MIYGVDLGTSNCLIAKLEKIGQTEFLDCLEDSNGSNSFPSVVHFIDENNVLIGQSAKAILDEQPDQTIELIKVRIGKEDIKYRLNTKERIIKPQELTALFLNYFKKLHDNGQIKKVVLTVPAYFNDSQKSATKQAADLADLEVVELIEEPSAALMYYFYNLYNNKKIIDVNNYFGKNILVFDFGGGTLDLSLIKIKADNGLHIRPIVLLKDGSNEIGGSDIDFCFTKYLLESLNDIYDDDSFIKITLQVFKYYYANYRFPDKTDEKIKKFILSLKKRAELAKIDLSDKDSTLIRFPNSAKYENEDIEKQEFEEVMSMYFRKPIIETLKRVRSKASHEEYSIDEIVLVGGSAKVPYIQKLIKEVFPNSIIKSMKDRELAVSKGAAIIGAIRDGEDIEPFGINRCNSCVSHDLFIEQKGHEAIKIVEKGTSIPFKPIHKYFTIKHALKTRMDIVIKEKYEQSSIKDIDGSPSHENIVKEISFYHPFFYTNEDVDVILDTDELGLWTMKLVHKNTNETIEFEAEKHTLLTGNRYNDAKTRISKVNINQE